LAAAAASQAPERLFSVARTLPEELKLPGRGAAGSGWRPVRTVISPHNLFEVRGPRECDIHSAEEALDVLKQVYPAKELPAKTRFFCQFFTWDDDPSEAGCAEPKRSSSGEQRCVIAPGSSLWLPSRVMVPRPFAIDAAVQHSAQRGPSRAIDQRHIEMAHHQHA
jgi:hypothetical protein